MTGIVQELGTPIPCAVSDTTEVSDVKGLIGFAAVTAGTLSVADQRGTFLTDFPVAAGGCYGFAFGTVGTLTITTAGGASGTASVAQ